VQPSHWAMWVLEHDNSVAPECGLQLACRWSADWQRPEWASSEGGCFLKTIVYVIVIRDRYAASIDYGLDSGRIRYVQMFLV